MNSWSFKYEQERKKLVSYSPWFLPRSFFFGTRRFVLMSIKNSILKRFHHTISSSTHDHKFRAATTKKKKRENQIEAKNESEIDEVTRKYLCRLLFCFVTVGETWKAPKCKSRFMVFFTFSRSCLMRNYVKQTILKFINGYEVTYNLQYRLSFEGGETNDEIFLCFNHLLRCSAVLHVKLSWRRNAGW